MKYYSLFKLYYLFKLYLINLTSIYVWKLVSTAVFEPPGSIIDTTSRTNVRLTATAAAAHPHSVEERAPTPHPHNSYRNYQRASTHKLNSDMPGCSAEASVPSPSFALWCDRLAWHTAVMRPLALACRHERQHARSAMDTHWMNGSVNV